MFMVKHRVDVVKKRAAFVNEVSDSSCWCMLPSFFVGGQKQPHRPPPQPPFGSSLSGVEY